jgi:hypothetical protein
MPGFVFQDAQRSYNFVTSEAIRLDLGGFVTGIFKHALRGRVDQLWTHYTINESRCIASGGKGEQRCCNRAATFIGQVVVDDQVIPDRRVSGPNPDPGTQKWVPLPHLPEKRNVATTGRWSEP